MIGGRTGWNVQHNSKDFYRNSTAQNQKKQSKLCPENSLRNKEKDIGPVPQQTKPHGHPYCDQTCLTQEVAATVSWWLNSTHKHTLSTQSPIRDLMVLIREDWGPYEVEVWTLASTGTRKEPGIIFVPLYHSPHFPSILMLNPSHLQTEAAQLGRSKDMRMQCQVPENSHGKSGNYQANITSKSRNEAQITGKGKEKEKEMEKKKKKKKSLALWRQFNGREAKNRDREGTPMSHREQMWIICVASPALHPNLYVRMHVFIIHPLSRTFYSSLFWSQCSLDHCSNQCEGKHGPSQSSHLRIIGK